MPIKLNPCAKCGGEAKLHYINDAFGREVEVHCTKCGIGYGMKSHYGARPALTKYWNAANPKEDKVNGK